MKYSKGFSPQLIALGMMLFSIIGLTVMTVPTVLTYTGVYDPAIDHFFEAAFIQTPYNNSLEFNSTQIEKINDGWKDDKEVGFCMKVEDGKVVDLQGAEEERADGESTKFGCNPSGYWNARVHTHPGLFGSAEMSQADRDSHYVGQAFDNRKVDCVVSGHVSTKDNPVTMNCFHAGENGDFTRYRLSIV